MSRLAIDVVGGKAWHLVFTGRVSNTDSLIKVNCTYTNHI